MKVLAYRLLPNILLRIADRTEKCLTTNTIRSAVGSKKEHVLGLASSGRDAVGGDDLHQMPIFSLTVLNDGIG
jgi:hypothetical protein